MNPDELNQLSSKVKDGSATKEEQLAFLKELNKAVDAMKDLLADLPTKN